MNTKFVHRWCTRTAGVFIMKASAVQLSNCIISCFKKLKECSSSIAICRSLRGWPSSGRRLDPWSKLLHSVNHLLIRHVNVQHVLSMMSISSVLKSKFVVSSTCMNKQLINLAKGHSTLPGQSSTSSTRAFGTTARHRYSRNRRVIHRA